MALGRYFGMKRLMLIFWSYFQYNLMPHYRTDCPNQHPQGKFLLWILWYDLNVVFHIYFTPKPSTTNENMTSRHVCLQRTSLCLDWWYTCGSSLFVGWSFAIFPTCVRSYIPFLVYKYMYTLCYIPLRLYCAVVSSDSSFSNNQMSSYMSSGVVR